MPLIVSVAVAMLVISGLRIYHTAASEKYQTEMVAEEKVHKARFVNAQAILHARRVKEGGTHFVQHSK